MKTVITTTGTSLLTNAVRDLKKSKETLTDEELRHRFQQVGEEKASAETNSLSKIASSDSEIILLYTATLDGSRCAKTIEQYLHSKNQAVSSKELPLEYNEQQFESHGLRQLVNILIEEINKAQRAGKEVVINATGGFKAEIAYTTMVGMIFQVPVKYIYEGFQNPITFPSLPVTWNVDVLLEYMPFFEWIDSDCRKTTEVEQRLKSIPETDKPRIQQLLSVPDSENYIFLSPAGQILWNHVKKQKEVVINDPPASNVPTEEKISNSLRKSAHHFPSDTLRFAQKLAEITAVEEIIGGHFENTTMKRVKKCGEDGIIRVLWADNEKAANLNIRTTARGQAQTIQLCDRYIRPLLED